MSNHQGSYMLNEVLRLLESNRVFSLVGKKRTHALLAGIVKLAEVEYDCNPTEIMEEIGERLGMCGYCMKPASEFSNGFCRACTDRFGVA